jgi:hypothetical protein
MRHASPVRRHITTHATGRPLKITFGEMRQMGVRGVLVYCHCGHHVAPDADHWPDDVRLSDPEPQLCARAVVIAARRFGPTLRVATSGLQSWGTDTRD